MNFAEKLYSLRKEQQLSQNELARRIGVSQASINYWEKGQRTPSIDAVYKLANYFNISVSELTEPDIYEIGATRPIGHNVKILREEKGYSIEQLSQLTKIPEMIIKEYESGARTPKNQNLLRLAAILDPVGERLLGYELPFMLWSPDDDIENVEKSFWGTNNIRDDFTIRPSEYNLINSFRELNDVGQIEAEKRVAELTEITRYIKIKKT